MEEEVKTRKRFQLRDLISAFITIIIVLGGGELTGTVDVLPEDPPEECIIPEAPVCPEKNCNEQEYSLAYVNNCATGETDRYICVVETGKCKSTQEILSELG